jgi:DNA-binding YbaB/EbfC family protein
MFKGLGSLMSLLANPEKIREQAQATRQRLAHVVAEGDAGGGMVKVRASGNLEVVSCTLSDEALRMGDREVLEDLIRAATNQALAKVREQTAQEYTKMAEELGLPVGMMNNLPGPSGGE